MFNPIFIFIILVPLSVFYLTAILLSSLNLPKALLAGSIFFGTSLYVAFNAIHWMPAFVSVSAILLFFAPKMKRNKKERLISTSLILTLTALFALTYTLELRRENKLINTKFHDIQVTQDEANPEIGYVTYKTKNAPRGSGIMLNLRCNTWCYPKSNKPTRLKINNTSLYEPNRIVPLKEDVPLAFAWPQTDLSQNFDLTLSIRGIDKGSWYGILGPGYSFLGWIPYTHHKEPHSPQSFNGPLRSYASKTIQVSGSSKTN